MSRMSALSSNAKSKTLFLLILPTFIIALSPDQTITGLLRPRESKKAAAVVSNARESVCGTYGLSFIKVPFRTHVQNAESKELFKRYGWTIVSKVNTFELELPPNPLHDAGEYPTKIYWAYNNELSKRIGLDFSWFLGKRVLVTIYDLREPLPYFMTPRVHAMGVVLKSDGTIVGAYIEAGRHDSFACSLDRMSLQKITNKDWGEWINGYINYDNKTEIKLSRMTPEEIIKEYYEALNRHDRTMAMACLARRMLCEDLFSNMDDSDLYNKDFPEDSIKSVKLTNIEKLEYLAKVNPPGVIEYKVTGEFRFADRVKVLHSDGINNFYVALEKETTRGGWRIVEIGTGP